ncbi:TonB-dependent receptor plug domain-containing protein [Bernardetia sp.]|uniref:TonB-dependent receptor plug domain-containing protein n=1 Tax=Bernardetia sp. TaxID=1937974 RepID=UPI0025C29BD0|nr:TonB-dependent receptor plug domain-containing protein [Bernardetia sp.]
MKRNILLTLLSSSLFLGISLFECNALFAQIDDEGRYKFALDELESEKTTEIKVITATKRSQSIRKAPATIMVITAEQIRERGYESLDDIFRDIPGFDLTRVHGVFPNIWAQRGLYGDENKRTLLMIDGIVENNILEGNVLGGSQYSLHAIERIEIIWGSGSALYGANAFNGIINLITKKGRDVEGLEYQGGYGAFQTQFNKVLAGFQKDSLDVIISGSLFNSEGPVFEERHPAYNASFVDNAYSIVGRINWKNLNIGFSRFDRPMGQGQFSNSPVEYYQLPLYGYQDSEGTVAGSGSAPINVAGERAGVWRSVTNTLSTTYRKDFSEKIFVLGKAYYRQTGIAETSYDYYYSAADSAYERTPYSHNSYLIGTEAQLDYNINANQSLIFGLVYEYSDVEKGYRGYESVPRFYNSYNSFYRTILKDKSLRESVIYQNFAAYGQYVINTSLLNATDFVLGVRYDQNNVYGTTVNPRLAVVSNPNDFLTIKLMAGSAYRPPNNFELFSQAASRIQNPDLLPEKVRSFEANFILTPLEGLSIETNGFYNAYSDIIVSNVNIGDIDGDGNPNFQNRNQGTAQVVGLETKIQYTISSNTLLFGNLTLQNPQQKNGDETPTVPNIAKAKGNLGFQATFGNLISLYGVANWVGERTTNDSNPLESVPSYTIFNTALSTKSFIDDRVSFVLSVNNIFNTTYFDAGIRGATGGYYGTMHRQLGRNGTLKIVVKI